MGHDPISTQLLTVPQFTLATMIMVPYCWHSDLHQERTYHYLGSGLVCTLGFILLAVISNHSIQYFATFFAVIGSYPQSVILHAWYANNIPQPSRRAVAVGLIVSMSNAAGFLASNIYRNQDKPRYVFGHVVCASFAFIGCTLTVLLSAYLKRENRRRDKIQGIAVKLQGVDASELQDHGDENVAYRYVT
ncbi:hypothetical protein K7432_015452 [Basidiobolus ranarum]|uniref:Uncharacterized protein n=1 Tax=Basidiobolus ranarum TaxID=34480 RepID=A0ABR2VN14_9FUNG